MRHRAKSVTAPILGILANVLADGCQLILARDNLVPVIELPQMLTDILNFAGASQLAVEIARTALEAPHEKAEVLILVGRAKPYAHDGMEMIRHQHKIIKLKLRIFLWQFAPIRLNLPPERIELAPLPHDRTENRLIARHLTGHKEPPIAIVDMRIAQGLAPVLARIALRPWWILRVHAHAEYYSTSLTPVSVRRVGECHTASVRFVLP